MPQSHSNPGHRAVLPRQSEYPLLPPSREGSVVLDIGVGTGALVVHARPDQDGMEIHVSPVNLPRHRTHAAVRTRHLPAGTSHAAVITPLPSGLYTVWDGEAAHGIVAVLEGRVSEYRFSPPQG